VDVLDGYTHFPEEDFDRHIQTFYPLVIEVMARGMSPEIQASLKGLLTRVGEVKGLGISKAQA
jgi:brefeldin A-inhibited guanine nucleotide-exchange protein